MQIQRKHLDERKSVFFPILAKTLYCITFFNLDFSMPCGREILPVITFSSCSSSSKKVICYIFSQNKILPKFSTFSPIREFEDQLFAIFCSLWSLSQNIHSGINYHVDFFCWLKNLAVSFHTNGQVFEIT